jgi:hypothetical protein
MTSYAVNESLPMSHRALLICTTPLARPDTASAPKHRVQQPRWPGTSGGCGHSRQPSRPMRTWRLAECGEPQQPFLRKPTREQQRHPILALSRRRPRVIVPQRPPRWQAVVHLGTRQSKEHVRSRAPTYPARRQRVRQCFRGLVA